MATSPGPADRQLSECPICLEDYEKPRALRCYHSLCEECLERIDFEGEVRCPLCNDVCLRDNVKPDFEMVSFLPKIKLHLTLVMFWRSPVALHTPRPVQKSYEFRKY